MFWSDCLQRPVAESNRSKRFCRPLTKSLIQPAVCQKRVQRYYKFFKYTNILPKKMKNACIFFVFGQIVCSLHDSANVISAGTRLREGRRYSIKKDSNLPLQSFLCCVFYPSTVPSEYSDYSEYSDVRYTVR